MPCLLHNVYIYVTFAAVLHRNLLAKLYALFGSIQHLHKQTLAFVQDPHCTRHNDCTKIAIGRTLIRTINFGIPLVVLFRSTHESILTIAVN